MAKWLKSGIFLDVLAITPTFPTAKNQLTKYILGFSEMTISCRSTSILLWHYVIEELK